jgi:hypothetical protein
MVCQFTCVSAVPVDQHACCHRETNASSQAFACAEGDCDHADTLLVAPAVIADRVITDPVMSISNVQLPITKAIDSNRLPWKLEVGVWKLTALSARTTQLRV